MIYAAVAALGLVMGPGPVAPVATRAVAPNMALLDFLNKPREILQSAVTIDNTKTGGAPETLAGKQTDNSWSPDFKFDRRNVKVPPKKVLGNTFPAALMPKAQKAKKK